MGQEGLSRLRDARLGFALSGGGARGAYTAGVMCGLREEGALREDLGNVKVLVGVSTGALVAAGVAHGDFDALEKLYTTVETGDVIRATHPFGGASLGPAAQLVVSATLGPPHLYDTAPMRKLVRDYVGEVGFQRMIDRKEEFEISFVSVDLVTGKPVARGNRTPGIQATELEDAVMASTNQPVLMDLVKIGDNLHCDGGLRDFCPAKQLMQSPFAKELDVFVSIPLEKAGGPPERPNPENIFDVLLRTIELLSYDVGDSDQLATELVDAVLRLRGAIEREKRAEVERHFSPRVKELLGKLSAPENRLQFLTIRPQEIPIRDSLVFEPKELRAMFDLGRTDGPRVFSEWLRGGGSSYVVDRVEMRGSAEN